MSIVVEIIFGIEMLLSKHRLRQNTLYYIAFLTEFWGDDYYYPIRDLKKIAVRYLK